MNYYNENDPKAASWLRDLVSLGLIPPGEVDERSIKDVRPEDLEGYTQCHFFAGIGGWSYALQLAGWPPDEPVWTGSCPCQSLSVAGSRKGHADERHLWPEFCRLILECSPPVVFGEQVASPLGRNWLAGVRADLEEMGYGVGAADLCAAGVGAPQIRQRLFWVADAGFNSWRGSARSKEKGIWRPYGGPTGFGASGWVADMQCAGSQGRGTPEEVDQSTTAKRGGPWSDARWLTCQDGRQRRIPVEPAFFPLAHGFPGRVAALKGFGNAIVPQAASEFVMAYAEGRGQEQE